MNTHHSDSAHNQGEREPAVEPPALDHVVDGEEFLAIESMRMLGFWSARAIFLMEFLYVAVFIAGFASIRNTSKPLPDPYLAIAEILILVMAPILVCLM